MRFRVQGLGCTLGSPVYGNCQIMRSSSKNWRPVHQDSNWRNIRLILGQYWASIGVGRDNGKGNGSYYLISQPRML